MQISENIKITGVYGKDGITPKQESQYRVGRSGYLGRIDVNERCTIIYSDENLIGKVLSTSLVESYKADGKGVTVTTMNTVYRFDFTENNYER